MIKKLAFVAMVSSVFLLPASQAEAQQVQLGPTVAVHDDFDLGIGAMVGVPIPTLGEDIGFLGDFTYFFPDIDDVNFWEVNGNLTWDIPVEGAAVAPFLLGGLNIARISSDISDASDTEMGLNLGGGIRFDAGTLEPLVGVRAEVSGAEGFVVFAALPFNVGD